MKPAATLIDELYRAACRNKTNPGWTDNTKVRHALEKARRFVLDESMASFLADLANESFIGSKASYPLSIRIADSLRVQARLPYEAIWIEYPLRTYQHRASVVRGVTPLEPWEMPAREGWLIQQHPKIDTAYMMHLWTQDSPSDPLRVDGYDKWTFPFAFGWTADGTPLPWHPTVKTDRGNMSSVLVGITGYDRSFVDCVQSPLIDDPHPEMIKSYGFLMQEWAGCVRRVWALLATINDIPTIIGTTRQTKGFLARGRIRQFLSHSTITLNVPSRQDSRVLARQMIAIAHRRRHPVRAHWRDDWRNPPSEQCKHLWETMDDQADRIECSLCHGRQTYIHKHLRGDARLGWVDHSYNVTHKENA